jgi:hypothetical protein
MTARLAIFAGAALILACAASPVWAGKNEYPRHGGHWRATHEVIYGQENEIALLEADPYVDDGYKAPIIAGDRADISRLHAMLPPARWRWTIPCCYSRRPIHIR